MASDPLDPDPYAGPEGDPEAAPAPPRHLGVPGRLGVRGRVLSVSPRVAIGAVAGLLILTGANVYLIGRGAFRHLSKPDVQIGDGSASANASGAPGDGSAPPLALGTDDVPPLAATDANAIDPPVAGALDDDASGEAPGAVSANAPSDPDAPRASKKTAKKPGTVGAALSSGCSTASVNDLSRQIIAEARCMDATAFATVPSRKNLVKGNQVFLYLEAPARDRLVKILDAHPTKTLTVNSALRTIAQQYLLYRWAVTKRCGIEVAANPGESNHESGIALDIREPGTWRPFFEKEGFKWYGPSDKVHFDYKGAGSVDHTGLDVLAFQKLWNANHPDDRIGETSHFDKETETRLAKAPAAGFPIGARCASRDPGKKASAPKKK